MTTLNESQNKQLQHSFEVELQYREGLEAITSPEGKLGEYLGSGDGTLKGGALQGTVRWDLYEVLGKTSCQTNLAGVIETDDGAKIEFETKGFGMVPDDSHPHQWYMAHTVEFDTEDKRYEWLNTTLAFWDGGADLETYRHHYHSYTRAQ